MNQRQAKRFVCEHLGIILKGSAHELSVEWAEDSAEDRERLVDAVTELAAELDYRGLPPRMKRA